MKMLKITIFVILFFAFLPTAAEFALVAYGLSPATIYLNDEVMDTAAFIEDGTTFVTLDAINQLGYTAIYDPASKTVILPGDTFIVLPLNSTTFYSNANEKACKDAKEVSGEVYIPFAVVARELGFVVEWKNQAVHVSGQVLDIGSIGDYHVPNNKGISARVDEATYEFVVSDFAETHRTVMSTVGLIANGQTEMALKAIIANEYSSNLPLGTIVGQGTLNLGNGVTVNFDSYHFLIAKQ